MGNNDISILHSEKLDRLIQHIQTSSAPWDGVLKLKLLPLEQDMALLGRLASHSNWLIRWVAVEKLVRSRTSLHLDKLVMLVGDERPEIRDVVREFILAQGVDER